MTLIRTILIIEDERDMARVVKDFLTKQGFRAIVAGNGVEGLRQLVDARPDYIILDIMLPDVDGIELCKRIREMSDVPILILSARGSDTDKVLGLGFGADDYMTKPFSLSELTARIQAYFRRHDNGAKPAAGGEEPLVFGELSINRSAYQVKLRGEDVGLTAKEFELLYFLAKHSNQVFAKSRLLDAVWGLESTGDENTVTVYIRRLREKLERQADGTNCIKTVWGVGYKFSMDSD